MDLSTITVLVDGHVLPACDCRILAVYTGVAQCCAQLHVPDRRAERDALIAATALVHRLRVITRNVADFKPMGIDPINPCDHTLSVSPAT